MPEYMSVEEANAALVDEGMEVEDYYTGTVLGFMLSDGGHWVLINDSMNDDEAAEWAESVVKYGEVVGLHKVGA